MEITATALQTVAPNGVVVFNATTAAGNPSILHREGSGLVSLRGLTNQWRARFVVNVGSATIDVARGCCVQISLENTSATPVDIQNAILNVERVA